MRLKQMCCIIAVVQIVLLWETTSVMRLQQMCCIRCSHVKGAPNAHTVTKARAFTCLQCSTFGETSKLKLLLVISKYTDPPIYKQLSTFVRQQSWVYLYFCFYHRSNSRLLVFWLQINCQIYSRSPNDCAGAVLDSSTSLSLIAMNTHKHSKCIVEIWFRENWLWPICFAICYSTIY